MDLRRLRTFAVAARHLNFTQAADELHSAPSSVTERIQALESDLGATLFDRSQRRLRLTPAEECLLRYSVDVLALVDAAKAAVADVVDAIHGTVAIGALETLSANWLPPLVEALRRENSNMVIAVRVAGSGVLQREVLDGGLDACFGFDSATLHPDLEINDVGSTRLVVLLPPGHRLGASTQLSVTDIGGEQFIVTEKGCVYRRMFDRTFAEPSVGGPRIIAELGSIAMIQRLVEQGLGCAIMPELGIVERGRAAVVPLANDCSFVPISMIRRARTVQPPVLRLLLAKAQEHGEIVRQDDARHQHAERSR